MTDDNTEREEEEGKPDHPPEWPKNDPVPAEGVELAPHRQTPPTRDDE